MIPGIVTALLLVLFIVGTVWLYHPRRKGEFEALGRMPLGDDDAPASASNRTKEQEESTR